MVFGGLFMILRFNQWFVVLLEMGAGLFVLPKEIWQSVQIHRNDC